MVSSGLDGSLVTYLQATTLSNVSFLPTSKVTVPLVGTLVFAIVEKLYLLCPAVLGGITEPSASHPPHNFITSSEYALFHNRNLRIFQLENMLAYCNLFVSLFVVLAPLRALAVQVEVAQEARSAAAPFIAKSSGQVDIVGCGTVCANW